MPLFTMPQGIGQRVRGQRLVAPDAFRWTNCETNVVRYDLPEAQSFSTSFCGKGGSPVPHNTRSGREIIIGRIA
ncbi:MAG TPA: hypothetical protein VGH13_24940 [Xanthobacteraceae bacterium]|jgi:hypothetical protein